MSSDVSARRRGLVAFIKRRLSPKAYLGLHLTAGLAILILACTIFSQITEDVVTHDSSLKVDQDVANFFYERTAPPMITLMKGISFLASGPFVAAAGVILAIFLLWRRDLPRVLMLLFTVPGGAMINVVLKHIVQRHRPSFEHPIETLSSFSYPSGHTIQAALFYGLLAIFVVIGGSRWALKIAALAGAGVMIVLVGLSRVYLGVHYLSDVLGAAAAGAAWLAFCVTAVDTYERRKHHRSQLGAGKV